MPNGLGQLSHLITYLVQSAGEDGRAIEIPVIVEVPWWLVAVPGILLLALIGKLLGWRGIVPTLLEGNEPEREPTRQKR